MLRLLSGFAVEDVSGADDLRLLGIAAHAVGHPSLAADFLDRAEARLRRQGRLVAARILRVGMQVEVKRAEDGSAGVVRVLRAGT